MRNIEAGDILECINDSNSPLKSGKKYIVLLVVNVGHAYNGISAGYIVRGYDHDQWFDWPYVWDRNRFKETGKYLPKFHEYYTKAG